jgi:hypothetical protein
MSEQMGSLIGGARIVREIGRGAMGVVFLAERCHGWDQVGSR